MKNIDKVGERDAPEEVTTKEEKFKVIIFFCYGNMNLDMDNYLKILVNQILWEEMNILKR